MEQETMVKLPSVPGTPLQQTSQDRINQLRMPQSPSIPARLNDGSESPSRRGSDIGVPTDVKSKIAFFSSNQHGSSMATNSFAIAASPTRSPARSAFHSPSKTHSRANSTISIPTNPAEITILVQTLQAQLEQSRSRERLVAERVESMMEQLSNAHTRARQEQQYCEKEIKSMKKQVHRAELALIKCQAELEETRKEQEGFKVRAEHERQAKETSRQEAFERARTLASNLEELEVVKKERDLLQSENDTLKSVQSSMQMAVPAEPVRDVREAGVQVQLETTTDVKGKSKEGEGDLICPDASLPDTPVPDFSESEAVREVQEELEWVKSQLKREQELVHFMNMQCQFRACPCRMAERAGVRFVHDHVYDQRRQELAKAKGVKRKADDDLPLPKYVTLRESLDQRCRTREAIHSQHPNPAPTPTYQLEQELQQGITTEIDTKPADDTILRAVPKSGSLSEDNTAGLTPLHEAAVISLPSPRSDDLEPTALLEDMTQVMVKPHPSATAKNFAFSTSTSGCETFENETLMLRQSHSAVSVSATDDLFDIAPPKHLPPRPSTVMGVRTIGSPIRMVPLSPEHRTSLTPTTSPPRHRTIQVPLKDSPLKNTITQRRSHSRPRSRSRARSPTPGRALPNANSPSADTYFPVTPKQKYDRPTRTFQLQAQPHSQIHALHTQLHAQMETTTMKVPVRGLEEDDVPSTEKSQAHAHTEPIETFHRGRQPLSENDPNATSQPTILPGTPISREAALAQIRARRDRARSVAMRKRADDENAGHDRINTPKSIARRGVILNREAIGRDISNLSQASAPARF